MNRTISLVFLICFISSFAQAYEEGVGFYAEYGKSFVEAFTAKTNNNESDIPTDYTISYTELEIHYVFKFWNIELIPYGGTKTWFISGDNIFRDGKPFCDIYFFGTKINYKNISFYYEHYCAHPVYSNYTMWMIEDYRMGQNSDKIAVRYQYN